MSLEFSIVNSELTGLPILQIIHRCYCGSVISNYKCQGATYSVIPVAWCSSCIFPKGIRVNGR